MGLQKDDAKKVSASDIQQGQAGKVLFLWIHHTFEMSVEATGPKGSCAFVELVLSDTPVIHHVVLLHRQNNPNRKIICVSRFPLHDWCCHTVSGWDNIWLPVTLCCGPGSSCHPTDKCGDGVHKRPRSKSVIKITTILVVAFPGI